MTQELVFTARRTWRFREVVKEGKHHWSCIGKCGGTATFGFGNL